MRLRDAFFDDDPYECAVVIDITDKRFMMFDPLYGDYYYSFYKMIKYLERFSFDSDVTVINFPEPTLLFKNKTDAIFFLLQI